MYRSVHELTPEEMSELKESYFYQLQGGSETENPFVLKHPGDENYPNPEAIPDKVIFEHFQGVNFVTADFFCNLP